MKRNNLKKLAISGEDLELLKVLLRDGKSYQRCCKCGRHQHIVFFKRYTSKQFTNVCNMCFKLCSDTYKKVPPRTLKEAAYKAYGGAHCSCCGEDNEAFLTFDHVNNDGAEHRLFTTSGKSFLVWLAIFEYPISIRILCMNCNWARSRKGGICPHEAQVNKLFK